MATEEQQTTKVFTEKKENSIFVQKITRLCDIHVTPAPKDALGTVDYYKDDSKKDLKEGWLSRYYDFKNRHRTCNHVVPDYYQDYGNKNIRKFMSELYPKLSRRGKIWLIRARYLLQEYMEEGFKQNIDDQEVFIPCKTMESLDIEFAPDFLINMYTEFYHISVMTDGFNSLELDNSMFRSFAFATHAAAYIDAKVEKLSIIDIYQLGTSPDLGDMWEGKKQIALILGYLMYDLPSRPGRTKQHLNEDIETLKEEVEQVFFQFGADIIQQGKQSVFNKLRDLINPIRFK